MRFLIIWAVISISIYLLLKRQKRSINHPGHQVKRHKMYINGKTRYFTGAINQGPVYGCTCKVSGRYHHPKCKSSRNEYSPEYREFLIKNGINVNAEEAKYHAYWKRKGVATK